MKLSHTVSCVHCGMPCREMERNYDTIRVYCPGCGTGGPKVNRLGVSLERAYSDAKDTALLDWKGRYPCTKVKVKETPSYPIETDEEYEG